MWTLTLWEYRDGLTGLGPPSLTTGHESRSSGEPGGVDDHDPGPVEDENTYGTFRDPSL